MEKYNKHIDAHRSFLNEVFYHKTNILRERKRARDGMSSLSLKKILMIDQKTDLALA